MVFGGRLISASPAITKPHFIVGAQKNTVVGPILIEVLVGYTVNRCLSELF